MWSATNERSRLASPHSSETGLNLIGIRTAMHGSAVLSVNHGLTLKELKSFSPAVRIINRRKCVSSPAASYIAGNLEQG